MERPLVESAEIVQAAEKCYACQRGLENLFDFPLVQVAGFERVPIPADLVLPHDREIYVDPDSKDANRKVPEEIRELFENESVAKERRLFGEIWGEIVVHGGWQWHRLKYGEVSHYQRAKILVGGGNLVIPVIEPFLSKLEGFVGQEVQTSELKPPEIKIDFPEDAQIRLSKDPLNFLKDDHQGLQRSASLLLLSITGRIGLSQMMSSVVKVATLSYEGRLYK